MLPQVLSEQEISEQNIPEESLWMLDFEGQIVGPIHTDSLKKWFNDLNEQQKPQAKVCQFSDETWQALSQLFPQEQALEPSPQQEDKTPPMGEALPSSGEDSNLPKMIPKAEIENSHKEILHQLHQTQSTPKKEDLLLGLAFLGKRDFQDREFIPEHQPAQYSVVKEDSQQLPQIPLPQNSSFSFQKLVNTPRKKMGAGLGTLLVVVFLFSGGDDESSKDAELAQKARETMRSKPNRAGKPVQRNPAQAKKVKIPKPEKKVIYKKPDRTQAKQFNKKTQNAIEELKQKRQDRSKKLSNFRSPKMMMELHKDPETLARERYEQSYEQEREAEYEQYGHDDSWGDRDIASEDEYTEPKDDIHAERDYDQEIEY